MAVIMKLSLGLLLRTPQATAFMLQILVIQEIKSVALQLGS
jgi:hypothetical protein